MIKLKQEDLDEISRKEKMERVTLKEDEKKNKIEMEERQQSSGKKETSLEGESNEINGNIIISEIPIEKKPVSEKMKIEDLEIPNGAIQQHEKVKVMNYENHFPWVKVIISWLLKDQSFMLLYENHPIPPPK